MKRRIYKKILMGILGFSALIFTAACSQTKTTDPAQTMEAFYQLIVYQNTKSITELGIAPQEAKETLKTYQSSMVSTIQKSFDDAGVTINKTQAQKIFQAISKKLAALDYSIDVVKENDKQAEVKVSSQYIHYLDIFKEAKDTTIRELKPLHIEDLSGAKKQLVENVIEAFENAKVSKEMHSRTFQLKKQKIKSGDDTIQVFFPKDYEQVGIQLIQMTTNQ